MKANDRQEDYMERAYLTINQAARFVGMSDTWMRRRAASGEFKVVVMRRVELGIRMGSSSQIKVVALEELARFVEEPAFKKAKRLVDMRKEWS